MVKYSSCQHKPTKYDNTGVGIDISGWGGYRVERRMIGVREGIKIVQGRPWIREGMTVSVVRVGWGISVGYGRYRVGAKGRGSMRGDRAGHGGVDKEFGSDVVSAYLVSQSLRKNGTQNAPARATVVRHKSN